MRWTIFGQMASLAVLAGAVAGCDLITDPAPSTALTHGLRWTATSETYDIAPSRLLVSIRGKNESSDTVSIFYGACNVRIRLYHGGQIAWDSSKKGDYYGTPLGCPLPLYARRIAPGDTIQFSYGIEIPDLMADSIADGSYTVTAEVGFYWDNALTQGGGMGEVAAGGINLAKAQPPLPAQRVVDSVAYTSATTISGRQIRATLTATNLAKTLRRIAVTDSVPFSLYGYSSRAARDTAWHFPTHPQIGYGPRYLTYRYADLPAGATQTFSFDVDSEVFRKTAAPGTYYLMVVLFIPQSYSLLLSAGEIVIP